MSRQIMTQLINDDLLLGPGPDSLAGIFAADASKRNHSIAYLTCPDVASKISPETFVLSNARLSESDNFLLRANKSVHRAWPTPDSNLNDSIRRDCYLVRWCKSIYCVGLFTDDASLLKVAGDLAWPCQVYLDRFLYDQEPMDMCELYMFDLKSEAWFNWRHRWHRTSNVPAPSDIYSVIGSERLTRAAKTAIDELWAKSTDDDA